MEHGFGSFAFIIMQESLSHTQRIVLIIIRSYTDLPDKLLLGGRKLRGTVSFTDDVPCSSEASSIK